MNKIIFYSVFFLISQNILAQEYILRQFPKLDTIPKTEGPNRKDYYASYYSFGYLFGSTDSSASDVLWSKSFWFAIGGRYKNKRTEFFNTGVDYQLEVQNFRIAQTNKKYFADTLIHKKAKYVQYSMSLSYFLRFNLTKRGNHLGKYIDLFGMFTYAPFNRYAVFDKINASSGSKLEKKVYSKLQFAENFYYRVGVRYGISIFQIVAFYRPDNLFKRKSDFPYAELPRFGAGIMLDIGNE